MAFSTSRTFTSRRRPPRLAGGINGSINAHSPSVRSLGYRRPLRTAIRRCSAVHMWCLLQSSAPHIESQPIHSTQQLSGSALSDVRVPLADIMGPIGVDVVIGEVTGIDHGRREVALSGSAPL